MKTKELILQISNDFIEFQKKADIIDKIAETWIEALKNGNKIIFCGNGGSASDSEHLVAELMGKYKKDRNPLPAISLTTNSSLLTAISNDYGYEFLFSRQLDGIGVKGDVLVGLSTSGNSKNVIEAFKIAQKKQIKTVAFVGVDGGDIVKYADIILDVPSNITNNIQEMHIAAGHIICGIVENSLFFDNF